MDEILGPMGLDKDYVRIKMEVDATKPLLAGLWYTRRNRSIRKAEIKFERLVEFCFGCGKVGYIERVCKYEMVMSESEEGEPMYGHG